MKISDELLAGSLARIQPLQSGKDASNGGEEEKRRKASAGIFETIFKDSMDAQADVVKYTTEMREHQLAKLRADLPRQMVASETAELLSGLEQQQLRTRVFRLVEEY